MCGHLNLRGTYCGRVCWPVRPSRGKALPPVFIVYVLLYFYLVLIVLLYFYYILGARHRNLHWSIFLCFCCKMGFNPPFSSRDGNLCSAHLSLRSLHGFAAKVHLGLEMSPGCTSSATLGREKFRP